MLIDNRRKELEKSQAVLKQKQHQDRVALAGNQKALRSARRAAYLMQSKRLRKQRMARKQTGLACFLGRVSGVELLKKQLHKYQDRKRLQRYREEREALTNSQTGEHKALTRRHEMQLLDLQRKVRALGKIEKRELKSLEESLRREAIIQDRGSRDHLPSFAPVLKKSKEQSKEQAREAAQNGREEFNVVASGAKPIDLKKEFDLAAGNELAEDEDSDSGEAPRPASQSKVQRYRRKRKRDQDLDRER